MTLEGLPDEAKTPELCLEAVKADGMELYLVPRALKTPALCLETVRQNGVAAGNVPTALTTPELCLEAVRQDGWALFCTPTLRGRGSCAWRLSRGTEQRWKPCLEG